MGREGEEEDGDERGGVKRLIVKAEVNEDHVESRPLYMSGCPFPFYYTCSATIIRYRAQYHARYSHLLKSEHPSGEIKASEYGKWDSAANSKPANEPKFGVALTLLSRHPPRIVQLG